MYILKEEKIMSKKYLYFVIAILLIAILCLFTYKTSEKVVFNNKESLIHDFGILNKNKTPVYRYTFKYVNTKYDSLKIYGIKDGCDCTESEVKKGFYSKNDTIFIKVKYNPNKYNDSGIIEKQMFLITNKNISKFDTIFPLMLKGKVN